MELKVGVWGRLGGAWWCGALSALVLRARRVPKGFPEPAAFACWKLTMRKGVQL